jgi:hypothetical protein
MNTGFAWVRGIRFGLAIIGGVMVKRGFLAALLLLLVVAQGFAASYVVPTDRFEIERSHAIVVGHVLSSHVEKSPQFGIETVTDVIVEEAIKGDAGFVIQIHELGGAIGDEARLIPGMPRFTDGDRMLLFLHQRGNGEYAVNDLALGAFRFTEGIDGENLLIRDESELKGRNIDGTEHKEMHRSAAKFLDYIRSIVRSEPAEADYFVSAHPFTGATGTAGMTADSKRLIADAGFTATSYTLNIDGSGENGPGARWNAFPGAVSFTQGNTESGAPGSPAGSTAISNAFSAWNGGGGNVHYVLTAGVSGNLKGILDPKDGINNIVFDKDLSGAGAGPYSCSSGGVLGIGGISSASGGGLSNMFHGETFFTTSEVDVSMNQGIANCGALLNSVDWSSAVTHEVGHTLGFRHADGNRTTSFGGTCSGDPNLDCATSAVMTAFVTHFTSFGLRAWDSNAVTALYGTGVVCTPPSISVQPAGSTISSGGTASLSVTATGTAALSYLWYIGSTGNISQPVPGGTTASIMVSPTSTTSYWVRVTGQCAPPADSNTATVTVTGGCTPPQISVQPTGSTISSGGTASLSVTATGTASLSYQWYIGNPSNTAQPVPGGTTASIMVSPSSTTTYWVRVTGQCAPPADSIGATVTVQVTQMCTSPTITLQPQDQSVISGNSANLNMGYIGTTGMVNWYKGTPTDTSNLVGTGQALQTQPLTTTSTFWARVTNNCGTADTRGAVVTVTQTCSAPSISGINANPATVMSGALTTLSVTATGTSLSYQWYKGQSGNTSTPISGGTNPSITDSPTVTTSYWVRVSSGCGAQAANSSTLTVTVGACPSPTITTPPQNQLVVSGTPATLTVAANSNGGGTLHYAWFQGQKNDTSNNLGIDSASITVGRSTTTSFWVRVNNDCGSVSSDTVTVTEVKLRRRPVGR